MKLIKIGDNFIHESKFIGLYPFDINHPAKIQIEARWEEAGEVKAQVLCTPDSTIVIMGDDGVTEIKNINVKYIIRDIMRSITLEV